MNFDISLLIVKIPTLLFAITIHEYAHGRVAYELGDPTAKQMGRLTLNPLRHIDPLGAIALFFFHFGWAKPVPVDPRYFKNIRKDTMLMALAGPMANFAAAFAVGMLIRYFLFPIKLYQMTLAYLLFMNIGLGLFNLLPIPPLDGSHVLENLLSYRAAQAYREIGRYGLFIIFGIVMLDNFADTGILNYLLIRPMFMLAEFFAGPNLAYLF
jgi:Zn-dependent protease